jgi:hypothetical protein
LPLFSSFPVRRVENNWSILQIQLLTAWITPVDVIQRDVRKFIAPLLRCHLPCPAHHPTSTASVPSQAADAAVPHHQRCFAAIN